MENKNKPFDRIAVTKKTGRALRLLARMNNRTIAAQAEIVVLEALRNHEDAAKELPLV